MGNQDLGLLGLDDCDKRFGDEWTGRIPAQLVAHILYFFSKQNDLVFDPMAGGGVVADTCLAFFMIRGQKVMLSIHLADLYNVEPKVLMQAAKRNIDRFPEDFISQLSIDEFENLKSQFVTSS